MRRPFREYYYKVDKITVWGCECPRVASVCSLLVRTIIEDELLKTGSVFVSFIYLPL